MWLGGAPGVWLGSAHNWVFHPMPHWLTPPSGPKVLIRWPIWLPGFTALRPGSSAGCRLQPGFPCCGCVVVSLQIPHDVANIAPAYEMYGLEWMPFSPVEQNYQVQPASRPGCFHYKASDTSGMICGVSLEPCHVFDRLLTKTGILLHSASPLHALCHVGMTNYTPLSQEDP